MEAVLIMTKKNKRTSRGWEQDTNGTRMRHQPLTQFCLQAPWTMQVPVQTDGSDVYYEIIHKSCWKLRTCSMVSEHCLAATALTRPHSLPWGSSLPCPQPLSLTAPSTPSLLGRVYRAPPPPQAWPPPLPWL